jgi:RimJ/RimL family protein N-acetyltransferase
MITHYYVAAALIRERHATLLAEAEAARQARPARPRRSRAGATVAPRPPLYQTPRRLRPARSQRPGLRARSAPAGTQIVLRDGSHVLVRQVHSADAPLLADGFARLSAASRWMRFLTPKKELSPAELRYFTDLDHHDHEALGALDNGDGRGVGIARFIRHADDPYAADIAVTIADDWQGRGLGSELLARLSDRARQEGIRRFTALVAAENVAVAGLLRNACASLVRRDSSTREYEIALVPSEEQDRPAGLELLSLPAGCR